MPRCLQCLHFSCRYDIDVCYKLCLQAEMVRKCGCVYTGIDVLRPSDYNGEFCFHDMCNGTQILSQLECIDNFYATLDLNMICQSCKQPACDDWSYFVKVSDLMWLEGLSAEEFVKDILPLNHPAVDDMIAEYGNLSNTPTEFVAKNFAKITIHFADIHVRHKDASATMTGFSLFSSLGGAFGFWIGFSIITFLEVAELLVRMLLSLCYIPREKTVRHKDQSRPNGKDSLPEKNGDSQVTLVNM